MLGGGGVPVDEVLGVDELELVQELDGEHQHGLERELAAANVEEVLEGRPEQLRGKEQTADSMGQTPP